MVPGNGDLIGEVYGRDDVVEEREVDLPEEREFLGSSMEKKISSLHSRMAVAR
jgi:hypothetical protein